MKPESLNGLNAAIADYLKPPPGKSVKVKVRVIHHTQADDSERAEWRLLDFANTARTAFTGGTKFGRERYRFLTAYRLASGLTAWTLNDGSRLEFPDDKVVRVDRYRLVIDSQSPTGLVEKCHYEKVSG